MRASFTCEHCGASVRCDQNGCPTVYHDCPESKAAARARWRCQMLALGVLRSAHVAGGKKARKLVKRVLALPCMQKVWGR